MLKLQKWVITNILYEYFKDTIARKIKKIHLMWIDKVFQQT